MAVDVQGKAFEVGQKVARAIPGSKGVAWVEVAYVTKIEGGKVYLDGSKVAIKFPERLAIIGMVELPGC